MGSNEFIRVKVEGISQLEKMRAFLDPKLFQKATRAGILAAATSANKQAGKSISQRYNEMRQRLQMMEPNQFTLDNILAYFQL